MGTSASTGITDTASIISPRAEGIHKEKIGDEPLVLDSPALLDLGHGTIRYRLPDERRYQEGSGKVKTGYFYHPRLDDFSEDAEIPAGDRFKFYYVFKGPKKDGRTKRLHYVYGTSFGDTDKGINQQPYKPQGKGFNWPESYRKANSLYYELIFVEQDEEEISDSEGVDTESDITGYDTSINQSPAEGVGKESLRYVVRDTETVNSLKKRLALSLLVPAVNFHVLYNKKELRNEDVIGDLRTPEQGNWSKFAVQLRLT